MLPDTSVSRRHAKVTWEAGDWFVHDLGSTNKVFVNEAQAERQRIHPGDRIMIGTFELLVEPGAGAAAPEPDPVINATIVRKVSDLVSELDGVSGSMALDSVESITELPEVHEPITETPSTSGTGKYFEYLNRLARDLIHTDSVAEVLEKVMDIAFAALPVDRGFILLGKSTRAVKCEIMRTGDKVEHQPAGDVPVSRSILRTVMEQEIGFLTVDAMDDTGLDGKSIAIHNIRSAMCAPLWSTDKITGFIQVDSPVQTGSFNETHLDFLITLANYAAVGVQRVQERRLRGRLERYHSPGVVDQVLNDEVEGGQNLRNATVTVLFGDLVGFTAFTETAGLEEVAELLDGYFNLAVEAIFEQSGTLDKFIGDCVMAFFGAPIDQPDHALRGVRAAVSLMDSMDLWNAERRRAGLPEVKCRIGLNSGDVVVGDVGSAQRVDYSVLGTTVNVAARLESAGIPGEIVIGEATKQLLGGFFELEPLGPQALKGLQQSVEAYRVVRTGDKDTVPVTRIS